MTLVVGVEDTVEGRAAIRWALLEAQLRGLPVRAVRAWTEVLRAGFPAGVLLQPGTMCIRDEAVRLASMLLSNAASCTGAAADVVVAAARGQAGHVLVEATEGADLVVVGSRHAGRLTRALLGSVGEHVLRHASCPVVVVPPGASPTDQPPRVLVGVDHSPASVSALGWAQNEARLRGWDLVPMVVHDGVFPMPDWRVVDGVAWSELQEREAQRVHELVPSGVALHPEVMVGHAGKVLVHAAEPQDLLVVGQRPARRGHVLDRLGSTSSYVAEHSAAPVVVVRGRAE